MGKLRQLSPHELLQVMEYLRTLPRSQQVDLVFQLCRSLGLQLPSMPPFQLEPILPGGDLEHSSWTDLEKPD